MNNVYTPPKKSRSSNIELLRIAAMMMIILHHMVVHCIYVQLTDASSIARMNNGLFNHPFFYKKLLILASIVPAGVVGNVLFILISGYFMISKGKNIDLGKTSKKLLFQLFFAAIVLVMIPALWHGVDKHIFINTLEIRIANNMAWFVGYYFLVIVIAVSFLNEYLCRLDQNGHQTFLIVSFAIVQFSFSGSLADGLTGGLRTLLTGIFLYALGGYIRLYDPFKKIRNYVFPGILAMSFLLICISSHNVTVKNIQYYYRDNSTTDFIQQIPAYENHSIIAIVIGVAIFEIFRRIHIQNNRIINFLGKSTFMVYLLHDNDFFYSIWNTQDWITLLYYHPYLFVGKILIWSSAVFGIGTLVYFIYEKTGNLLEKYKWLVLKSEHC